MFYIVRRARLTRCSKSYIALFLSNMHLYSFYLLLYILLRLVPVLMTLYTSIQNSCNTEAHAATADGEIEKTIKSLINKFECQSFSALIKEYVGSSDICYRIKYAWKGPIGYVILFYIAVRLWSNITMDFLKLLPVFTKYSVL